MRRTVRGLSSVLIVIGALLLADAAVTLAWREPVSSLYAQIHQQRLAGRLDDLEEAAPAPAERRVLAQLPEGRPRLGFAARSLDRRAAAGDAVGRIRAPAIGLDEVFVEGTRTADLRRGPGHYPGTSLPGAPGTVALAGHRTTYGAPFRHLDRLDRGDRIEVVMPYGRFSYAVERIRIVAPTATWVTQRASYDRLVLTACHPLYSASERLVVFARLVGARAQGMAA